MATGADGKHNFKPLDDTDVAALAGSGSYGKGMSYYRGGHIIDPVLRGVTLEARCYGSDDEPYTVKAMLATVETPGDSRVVSYMCSCPRGGFCKHIVALLLTWVHKPETFEVRPEIADLLQNKTREELLVLVQRMLERAPELESLLDLPIPVAQIEPGAGNRRTVDPAPIRKQVRAAFRDVDYDYDWGAGSAIASALEELRQTGDDYLAIGQYANAQVVYTAIAEEAIEQYGETDDEGDIAGVIGKCCEGLAQCLDAQAGLPESERLLPEDRARLLKILYDLWRYDMLEMGGIDLAVEAPEAIARNVTDSERAQVETWLKQELGAKRGDRDTFSRDFEKDQVRAFLLQLKAHSGIDDAELLEEYRKYGFYGDMARLLAKMGRVEEALQLAATKFTNAAQVTDLADRILALGEAHREQAFAFVEQRSQVPEGVNVSYEGSQYINWLATRYAEQGMAAKALEAELRRFVLLPGQETYKAVQRAAQRPGLPENPWSELRDRLIADLKKKDAWEALVRIYLEEGQAREALDALARLDESRAWYGSGLHAQVAKAAESAFPDEARTIYLLLAENLIEHRGRENYQQAAVYLARVRDLYRAQGRLPEWQRYITDLRERNKRLSALREELDTLGLKG